MHWRGLSAEDLAPEAKLPERRGLARQLPRDGHRATATAPKSLHETPAAMPRPSRRPSVRATTSDR